MIKAYKKLPNGQRKVLLGLSDENEKRMLDDQPVRLNLKDLSSELPNVEIFLVRGETETAIIEKISGEKTLPKGWLSE